MPEGVSPSASSSALPPPTRNSSDEPSLADIQLDLSHRGGDLAPAPGGSSSRSRSRGGGGGGGFEEYQDGDADVEPSRAQQPTVAVTAVVAEHAMGEDVEVVKVVKKTKKKKSAKVEEGGKVSFGESFASSRFVCGC